MQNFFKKEKILLAIDITFCYYIKAVFSAKTIQGGASAWQSASSAIRALPSGLRSATPTDVPTAHGSPM
jgi:hypothetical protein